MDGLKICVIGAGSTYPPELIEGFIVRKFGEEAGVAANAIIRRLGLEKESIEVVLAGSVFKGKGPLILALEGAGIAFKGKVAKNLDASIPEELRRT